MKPASPRRLVFDALTKPALLKRWLGVFGEWTMPECEVDLRVGGGFRYGWRGPNGATMGMRGVYQEIDPPARLVATEVFDESWYPGEAVDTPAVPSRTIAGAEPEPEPEREPGPDVTVTRGTMLADALRDEGDDPAHPGDR